MVPEVEEREELSSDKWSEEISALDQENFLSIISTGLSGEQKERIATPPKIYPRQKAVLAIHWHPEFIPLELIMARLRRMFPAREEELIIPTQHNVMLALGDYAGVEVDCYSSGFNRKVQLLLHFKQEKGLKADKLNAMLRHTFKYRSGQLFEYMDSIVDPRWEERLQEAAADTGASQELVRFTRLQVGKLRRLLEQNLSATPPSMIKNKLVAEFLDSLRDRHPAMLINRAQLLVKAVKTIVKRNFPLQYFFRASEVIEEVRSVGGGVVIPHPEQFWPILLADYDVDGYEVWNPQSREYTDFLIEVVHRQNRHINGHERPLLIFMGDDTHLGEKARPLELQNRDKAAREVGLQQGWEDPAIRKKLIMADLDAAKVIQEYRARLV